MKLIEWMLANPGFTLVGAFSIIQIVPIKFNPWTLVLNSLKSILIGDLETKVNRLADDIQDDRIERTRWAILDFSNSCMQNIQHTREEWVHCIKQLDWYATYTVQNNIKNGEIEECDKYLRELYHNLTVENKFL